MNPNEAQKVYFPANDERGLPMVAAREGPDVRHYLELWRVKVPGGWLLLETGQSSLQKPGVGGALFFPDPEHTWDPITVREEARSMR